MTRTANRPHGYARYKLDGCRCYTCGYAVAQYNDHRDHAIRRGEWQPYVDAAPARDHVTNLRACGLGLRRIAALAGIERNTVAVLLNGRSERGTPPPAHIRPATAAALLAIEPGLDNLAAGTVIDAAVWTRRLQALAAHGWPHSRLAAELGWTPGNFSALITTRTVTVGTARRIRDLYTRLHALDPRDHGVLPGSYTRARNHAIRLAWAGPMCWDDDTIDDPAAHPEWTGECGTATGYYIHRRDGIPFCPRCRAAVAAHNRDLRAATATDTTETR